MKNKGIFAACVFTLLFCSCRKTYTCRCDGGALGNGKTISIENKTKQQAQSECDSYNSNAPLGYHNCVLK